jgi:hypothetical protein
MTRNTLLARCSAAAAAATLLAGLAAAPAMARPDPGESTTQIELNSGGTKAQIEHDDQLYLDGRTKAQIEHDEQLYLDGRTKAQIEHDEQLSVPSTGDENVATSSSNDEFPWAVASLAAAGFVAVAAGGVVMQRQRKTALASA